MKKYIVLAVILGVEMVALNIAKMCGISIESPLWNALGLIAFFAPVELLLFFLNRDTRVKTPVRIVCRVFFWVILGFLGITGVVSISSLFA
ncbi:MAG: hypothetical protein IJY86_00795 [Clostridia bacterium]|nr:hypothetical protein [Clostridia bacterium]